MTDSTGTSSWSFDAAGRISSTTTGAGKTLGYSFDASGLRTALTYPDGSTVKYGLDAAGRVTSQTDSTGTVGYGYDASSNLTRITRPNNTTSTYSYDSAGQITKISHTGSTPGVNDNAAPQAPSATAPATPAPAAPAPTGTPTPTPSPSASVVPSPTPTPTVTPTPAVPATPTATPTPTATASASATGTASTGIGLVPAVTGAVTGLVCGLLPVCPDANLTAADGLPMTLSYGHDTNGRVTSLDQVSASKHLTTTYSYDKLGRLTASTRTDGVKATYGYDAAGNRVSGTDTDRLTGQILGYHATYSATNQLVTQTVGPRSASGLLGSEVGTVTTTNTWDANGEQTASKVDTIQTATLLGVISGTKTSTLATTNSYDFTGRLTKSSRSDNLVTSYSYDGLGRTVGETLPDEYASDHLTPTLSRLLGGTGCGTGGTVPGCPAEVTGDTPFVGNATTITNDGVTPVSWATGKTSINLMWGPEGADHQTTSTTDDGKTTTTASWLYLDAQGTVRATADSAGATLTASSYTDFGAAEPTSGSLHGSTGGNPLPLHLQVTDAGAVLPNTTTTTPIGYTGQQNNPDAGLIQYQARTYQPEQAQWMQADSYAGTLDTPQSQHRYGYVTNNPATFIDPDGHRELIEGPHGGWVAAPVVYPTPTNSPAGLSSTVNGSGADAPTFSDPWTPTNASTVNSSGADPSTPNCSAQPAYEVRSCYATQASDAQNPRSHSAQAGYGAGGGNWTDNLGKAAQKFGVSPKDFRDAIHKVKGSGKFGGRSNNPDVEVDTATGEVRIKGGDGESIGNVEDYLGQSVSSPASIDWGQVFQSIGAGIVAVLVILIATIISPITVATA
ncbi:MULTISPECIES: RHS repeat-associated core domain-containing protein [unclassified Leifsonia]|uniref:RHS repeat-associated core domain-containing protein n=1 Tax=unclassified Leifsonia TaxID=2663824 RepID=UPI0008A7C23A|nr:MULTISPECIES: RHS repeat-associated core domain-containing protein [unclassified Leifsonia]SEI13830.1 RHS repeat-associated core domain-containing protein [Leifsonia sp. CL154]SFL99807.1 RHS repeat-associated core domain-containing protein [Leifsonia sp. CL147]